MSNHKSEILTYGVWTLTHLGDFSFRLYWKQNAIASSSLSHRVIISQVNSTVCGSKEPSSRHAINRKLFIPVQVKSNWNITSRTWTYTSESRAKIQVSAYQLRVWHGHLFDYHMHSAETLRHHSLAMFGTVLSTQMLSSHPGGLSIHTNDHRLVCCCDLPHRLTVNNN